MPTSAARIREAGAFGSVMRCQLTSVSASTAITVAAFGSSEAAQWPSVPTSRPSGLVT